MEPLHGTYLDIEIPVIVLIYAQILSILRLKIFLKKTLLEIITEENVRNYFGNNVGILPVPYMNEEIKALVMLDISIVPMPLCCSRKELSSLLTG